MTRRLEIILLYVLLTAGGLWHLLGWFQVLMQRLAGVFLIGLSILLLVRFIQTQNLRAKSVFWATIVILGGFSFEWIGLRTGIVFGHYLYGDILQPQAAGVPIAIGFAWLSIQLSAAAVAQRLMQKRRTLLFAVVTALLMVGFDFIMEPAAVYLRYWQWQDGLPPLQNYVGWFLISLIFSSLGTRWKMFETRLPDLIFHSFWAELIYFLLIILRASL